MRNHSPTKSMATSSPATLRLPNADQSAEAQQNADRNGGRQVVNGNLEYTLIDCATGLIYGPYETFHQARDRAETFERWDIINRVGNLIDWSPEPSTVLTATGRAA